MDDLQLNKKEKAKLKRKWKSLDIVNLRKITREKKKAMVR